MPYNFAADSFHKKKLCSRLSSSEVRFFYANRPFSVFRLPLGDLGATYDDHLRLIRKRVVDFLLALIELFSLGSPGATGRLWEDKPPQCVTQASPDSEACNKNLTDSVDVSCHI